MNRLPRFLLLTAFLLVLAACQAPSPASSDELPRVLAAETFLADIAQNVAGARLQIDSLIPAGADPHAFEPTPSDAARISESQVLILNGAGFEESLVPLLENLEGDRVVIEASQGLTPRTPDSSSNGGHAVDPHFWLDPSLAVRYVENIRAGLSEADPQGAEIYSANAEAYIAQLMDLDAWAEEQISQIPPEDRLLVTNHESFGYFADRYGFQIVGAIIPNVSSSASPSAQELARLVDQVESSGAKAVFMETGSNAKVAEQIAADAGIKVSPPLYTHSLTPAGGDAPTYIDMIRYNVRTIVEALN